MTSGSEGARLQLEAGTSLQPCIVDYSAMYLQSGRKIEDRIINRTFTYCSISAGFGLVVVGSILTYIFQDQARYARDPFKNVLHVTAILFIIIGLLLISTSLIKLFVSAVIHGKASGECAHSCFFDEPFGSTVKAVSNENAIVYNPCYPPVLIPYSISGDHNDIKKTVNPAAPDFSFSFLPGSVIFENQFPDKRQEQDTENFRPNTRIGYTTEQQNQEENNELEELQIQSLPHADNDNQDKKKY